MERDGREGNLWGDALVGGRGVRRCGGGESGCSRGRGGEGMHWKRVGGGGLRDGIGGRGRRGWG